MRRIPIIALGLMGVAAGGAGAAPQALLVAAKGDIALYCEGAECTADVTTICLQRDREMPAHGTRYSVVDEPDSKPTLSLVGRQGKGQEVRIANQAAFTITAERSHLAVKLSVPRALLARFGATELVARVSGPVVLVPESVQGDRTPHTEADVAQALNSLRPAAEGVLKRFGENLGAARLLHDVANGISRHGQTSRFDHEAAWQRAVGDRIGPSESVPDDVLKRARDSFQACLPMETGPGRLVNTGPTWAHFTFRDCLGAMHNGMIGDVNGTYWDEVFFGS